MSTKGLLFLLVSLTLLVNYYSHIDVDNKKLSSKITMIKQRIAKEKNLQGNLSKEDVSSNLVDEMLYAQTLSPTVVLAKLQTRVEEAGEISGMNIVNISWGEPYVLPLTAIRLLPLRFNAEGKPFRFLRFIKYLQNQNKIFKPETIAISIKKEQLSFQIELYAFQKVADEK